MSSQQNGEGLFLSKVLLLPILNSLQFSLGPNKLNNENNYLISTVLVLRQQHHIDTPLMRCEFFFISASAGDDHKRTMCGAQ